MLLLTTINLKTNNKESLYTRYTSIEKIKTLQRFSYIMTHFFFFFFTKREILVDYVYILLWKRTCVQIAGFYPRWIKAAILCIIVRGKIKREFTITRLLEVKKKKKRELSVRQERIMAYNSFDSVQGWKVRSGMREGSIKVYILILLFYFFSCLLPLQD